MGVFAWFRRKGKESAAASTEETATTPVTADGEAAAEAEAAPGTAPEMSGTTEADETAAAPEAAAEGVDIPKQQSAEEAADNEAGEGARK
ncbi:hypothetical protein [Streptomyces sp. NPDC051310]|uniref:hypothetical protein n=1 Tax=Streptomyces sp. NPDC051310 TaxID=3365649 RepID=UPI0037AB58A5